MIYVNSVHLPNHSKKQRNIGNIKKLSYKNLTAKKLSSERKTADIIFLDLHRRMTVPVQSYGSICMTEQLTESFEIKTFFNADGSVSVPEKMKVGVSDTA